MDFIIHLAIIAGIYSILALSLNLLVGFTGLVSLASAAFMGIGAYVVAIVSTQLGVPFLALPLAVICAGIIAFLVDYVLSRFKGGYFTLGSMAIVAVAAGIFVNWTVLTNGAVGIANIPAPSLFGLELTENWQILGMTLMFVGLVYIICELITRSSFGRVLRAIREDEGGIEVFGYNTSKYKLVVFVVSSMLAALAGGVFAVYATYISPDSFTITDSIMILTMVILGGVANNKGVILGALLLVLLPEMLRFVGFPVDIAADVKNITYGLILIILMMYRPQGLTGSYKV